jgi:hypothetical protein
MEESDEGLLNATERKPAIVVLGMSAEEIEASFSPGQRNLTPCHDADAI